MSETPKRMIATDPRAPHHVVYCDGLILRDCIAADEHIGVATCFERWPNGQPRRTAMPDRSLVTFDVFGKIEIRSRDSQ